MWTIKKPSLRTATGKDLDYLVNNNKIDAAERPPLNNLYEQYDHGNGSVTDAQHDVIPAITANKVKALYKETYAGGDMEYLRDELFKKAPLCPMCSITSDLTLDHYMPESRYKALAVCRLNLVPACGTCNRKKNAKDYRQFVHSYYDNIDDAELFKAKCYVLKHRFVIRLSIDDSVLTDRTVVPKVNSQVEVIDLLERVNKAARNYVTDLFTGCSSTTTAELKIWLQETLTSIERTYKKNDWRYAVVKGILGYPKLDIADVIYNKTNPKR